MVQHITKIHHSISTRIRPYRPTIKINVGMSTIWEGMRAFSASATPIPRGGVAALKHCGTHYVRRYLCHRRT